MGGNTKAVSSPLGAANRSQDYRQQDDYYATDPVAMEGLLEKECFSPRVWECACGGGHLSKVLERHGYDVRSTDLVDRGYGTGGVDFLKTEEPFDGDIITNPPYKLATEFVRHALETVTDGHRVAMFLRLQFLEGVARYELFQKYPPKAVYVATKRINCRKNGDFQKWNHDTAGALAHAWFIWEKGFHGEPVLRWFHT